MPSFKSPTSDKDRLAFLEAVQVTAQANQAEGDTFIQMDTLTEITAFLAVFQARYEAVPESRRALQERRAARKEAVQTVRQLLLSYWTVAKLQAQRLEYPPHVMAYYGLYQDGRRPRASSITDVLAYAQMAVSGDAAAVAQGYRPVHNPSAAELETALTAAQAAHLAVPEAERDYSDALAALAQSREQANWFIRLTYNELRVSLMDRSSAERLRVMRTYGVTFYYRQQESDAAVEEPAAAETAPDSAYDEEDLLPEETAVLVPVNGNGLIHA